MEITADSLQLLHTSSGIAGILGLQHMKNKSLGNSLFSQMRDKDLLTSFGYCRGNGNNGTFIWADSSTEGDEVDIIGQMHWATKLGGIKISTNASAASLMANQGRAKLAKVKEVKWSGVDDEDSGADEADKELDDINKELEAMREELGDARLKQAKDDSAILKKSCPEGKCTAILDTGSNILAGPTDAMKSISNLVNVKPDCSNFDTLPNIHMTLGSVEVSIPPSGYVMKMPMPKAGMGGYGDGEQGDEEAEAPMDSGDGDGDMDGLTEKRALSVGEQINRRWKAVFDRLNRNHGVDLREAVDALISQHNSTGGGEFMCMAALVPLDKSTAFGPLWIVGTPMMDAYYTRFSWAKGDASPKVHLKALEESDTCKEGSEATAGVSTPGLLRSEKAAGDALIKAGAHKSKRGPTERRPEEIAYPHWAKALLHV